jgi:hypothetical protein
MSDDKEIFKIVLLGEGRVGLFLKIIFRKNISSNEICK